MPATRCVGAAPVGERAGEGEEDQVAARHEGGRQAVVGHLDRHVAGERGLGDGGERVELDHMVLAEPLRPVADAAPASCSRIARPHRQLDRVALAVVEADGLDPRKALERPGQADGGILPAGEQHQRGVGADASWAHRLQYFGRAHDGSCATILGNQRRTRRTWPTRRGMIAVDKMGTKVLFLNPVTYETEVVLDGFDKTVHELLVVPETNRAYVPIFGDGIHGRNPNPQHWLCVFDLDKRALIATIDLRPYIAPHTLKLGPDGLIYITCENSAKVVVDRPQDQQGGGRDRFRLDQRPPPDHRAGRPAALHRERGGRHGVGDRPAEAEAARQDQDALARSPASRSRPTAAPWSRSTTPSRS